MTCYLNGTEQPACTRKNLRHEQQARLQIVPYTQSRRPQTTGQVRVERGTET